MNEQMFAQNRNNYLQLMAENSVSIFFAGEAPRKSADETYPFVPNRNFYYLTGISAPKIVVVCTKTTETKVTAFIERANPELARWVGETLDATTLTTVSGIGNVRYLDELTDFLGSLFSRHQYTSCGFDLERQTLQELVTPGQQWAQRLQSAYPGLTITNEYYKLAQLRMIKTPEEIAKLETAIALTQQGIEAMVGALKPGVCENEIEAHFDFTLKRGGASDFAFPTICATGKNATILHYHENCAELQADDLILFDLGAQVEYYNADISRTFPVSGTFNPRQRAVYEIVLQAMNAVEQAVKPGVTFAELNQIATDVLATGCLAIGLIREKAEIKRYYIHSIGHHLGLDTHDVGDYQTPLAAGMVITNEPGLYIPEEGLGIRIEDDLLVTDTSCRNLSEAIPKTITEIETLMLKK